MRVWLARWCKMQRAPFCLNLAAASPEKTAEIDDRRAHLACVIHQHVHDPAHVLVGRADHLLAENPFDLVIGEYLDLWGDLRPSRRWRSRSCWSGCGLSGRRWNG